MPGATPSTPNVVLSGPSGQQGTIKLTVSANSISSMAYGVAFDLDFDPTVSTFNSLQKESFFEGSTLSNVTYLAATATGAQVNPGKLIVSVTRLGNIVGATGTGNIISLTFNITGKLSATSLTLSSNNLLDPTGQPLAGINWSGGMISVQ